MLKALLVTFCSPDVQGGSLEEADDKWSAYWWELVASHLPDVPALLDHCGVEPTLVESSAALGSPVSGSSVADDQESGQVVAQAVPVSHGGQVRADGDGLVMAANACRRRRLSMQVEVQVMGGGPLE